MLDFSRPTIFYGGSFDPLHLGHLHVAVEAQKFVRGARLVFVPAGESPGKRSPNAPGELRQQWIQDCGFSAWDFEINRDGPSYTVDTLEAAHALGANPSQTYWLMGADAYASFSSWRNPARIRELARLLVASRPGTQLVASDSRDTLLEIPNHPASSSAIRKALSEGKIPADSLPEPVSESLRKLSLPGQNPYAIQE